MKIQRIKEIEELIHTNGSATIEELCSTFNVSKNTIRRDINKIAHTGTIKKVYGGVVSLNNQLLPFENRDTENFEDKKLIGMKAAKLIEDNDLIFIDSGTTTRYIIEYIDTRKTITIITNNLDVINSAAEVENFKLLIIGNTFKRTTKSFINVYDWEYFKRININKAFMATTGLSLSKGATNSDMLEYDIKHHIMEKAEKRILLADSSKFDKTALVSYASITDFQTIVTNGTIPSAYSQFCQDHNIQILN